MSDAPHSVDQLRARLRDLGYLEAGVDRFVLAPVGPGRGVAAVAFGSSLRIGLLAALLLGPSTAVGLGARVPGLVVGPRDGLVLAIYLGAVFLVAVALTAFAVIAGAGLLVGRSGRASAVAARAAILARGAGLVVGAGTLAYLMFWWRGTGAERAAWHQPLWTAVALAGAAGFSVLVGHSVTTAAQAVIAVAAGSADPVLGRRRRSLATTAIVWALACAGAAGLLQIAGRGTGLDPRPDVPHLDRRTTGVSILVLGIDGFDPVFAERLVAAGRLPAIGTLLAGGRAHIVRDGDADPAAVWTSIATGQPVDVHGVRGIEARRVSGLGGEVPAGGGSLAVALAGATDLLRLTRPAASSGRQRRAKTFWEVAGEQGLRVGVVNWWATWPAPENAGAVVSDRASLRLERGGTLDAEMAPASLYEELSAAWPGVLREARRRAVAVFDGVEEPVGDALRRGAEQDLIQLEFARRIAPRAPDLLAVYLPGLDIAQYAIVSGPSASGLPASALAARLEALERYYLFLDGQLAQFLAAGSAWQLSVLATDPGRSRTRSPGVVAFSGDMAQPGARAEGRRPDVAPTILHLLGLPVSRELGGRVCGELLQQAFVRAAPVQTTATYGRRVVPAARPDAVPLDDAAFERLRSLGYIR